MFRRTAHLRSAARRGARAARPDVWATATQPVILLVYVVAPLIGIACGGTARDDAPGGAAAAGGAAGAAAGGSAGASASGGQAGGAGTSGGGTHSGCQPPCGMNATCVDSGGELACQCEPGFAGDGWTCGDVDECSDGTHDCNANADCTNQPGDFTCACKPGW